MLLETESRWTMAEELVCEEWGAPFSMDLKRRLLGSALPRAGEILAEWVGAPVDEAGNLAEALIVAYRQVVDAHGVVPMPGAAELLTDLHGRFPLAVASNTREVDTRNVLERSGLPWAFDAIVCAGDGIAPKPEPDVYLAACAALNADPSDAVAFEDSPLGATAAAAAGMFVIGVPSTVGIELTTHTVVSSLESLTADDVIFAFRRRSQTRPA